MPIKWPATYNKSTSRHKEWATLKKKHADPIKKSKLNFDADLGSLIDAFESLVAKVAAANYGATATNQDLEKVSAAGLKAKAVATSYKGKLSPLPDPAKKELAAFLSALESDALAWADGTLYSPAANSSFDAPAWAVVAAIDGHLDTISKRLGNAINTLHANANFSSVPALQSLHQHLTAIHNAVGASLAAGRKIEPLVVNAANNPAYRGVLKTETAKALAGPFKTIFTELAALDALLAAELAAKMNFENPDNTESRTACNNLKFLKEELTHLAKTEKALIV